MKKFSSEQIRFVTLSKVCYYFYSDNLHSMLALYYTTVKYGKDQKYLTNWFKIFVGYFFFGSLGNVDYRYFIKYPYFLIH